VQLLVALEDRVRVYQVMEKELRLAYEVALRGVLRVPNTKQFFSMTKVIKWGTTESLTKLSD
jgi:hypothetical protein